MIYIFGICSIFASVIAFAKSPEHIQCFDKIINQHCLYVENKYDLQSSGIGGRLMTNIEEVDLSFKSFKEIDIDSARKLIIPCVEYLISQFNEDSCALKYLNTSPISSKEVQYKILFSYEDDPYCFVEEPGLAKVAVLNGRVIYWVERDRLIKIYEETYDNAKRIVYDN